MDTISYIFLVLSSVGLIENLLFIIVIITDRKLRRIVANKFFLNVTIWCFLFDCVGVVRSGVDLKEVHIIDVLITTVVASALAITSLTLDRMLAIKFPYRYQALPPWPSYLAIFLCWVMPLSYLVASFVIGDYAKKFTRNCIFVSTSIVTIISLLFSNIIIFIEAQKQLSKICKTQIHVFQIDDDPTSLSSNSTSSPSRCHQKRVRREAHLAYCCFGVVIIYCVLWLPITIEFLVSGMTDHPSDVMRVLAYMNPVLMPAFYAWYNRNVRNSIRARLCCSLAVRDTSWISD